MPRRAPLLLLAALLVAAGSRADAQGDQARPRFENGQAQIVPAFADSTRWIRQQLWVETGFDSDGDGKRDRMHVNVTRPRETQTNGLRLPVIYETSPYFAGTSGAREFLWDVRQEVGAPPPPRTSQPSIPFEPVRPRISNSLLATWVPRGFIVVHSESPGTGLSQGCPTVGGDNESLAPKAVIDWLNGRAKGYTTIDGNTEVVARWATGKVGMTGTSYEGTLPIAAATTGVEGLEAIIPIAPNTSYYHYYRSNGLVRHPGGWLGEDIDFLYDFINSGHPSRREYCNRTIRDGEMAAGRDRTTGDQNPFWVGRDYLTKIGQVRAATLMAHAFNDWNVMPEHSVRIIEALKARRVPVQAYFHQGGHGGAPPLELMNRWFTRYLFGIDNGVERDPRAWIVREGDERSRPTPYADYPNPDARAVTLRLGAAEREGGIGTLSSGAGARQGRETLVDDVSQSGQALARATNSRHRLLYASQPLAAPLHISGTSRVTIRLASSTPAANLAVWLVALSPDSAQRVGLVTAGWADPQNHQSLSRGEPLVPGQMYTVAFDLQPDDQIIPTGHRLALMIFSSDRDFTLWPRPGTELTVDVGATSLQLPVVGGASALARAIATGPALIEHRDIEYSSTKGVSSRLDLYQQQSAAPSPVLLYFHGGAWTTGERPKSASSFRSFLALGFSVVSVSYRLSGVAPAPAAVQDARCAVKWVHDNAARFGLDPERIVVHGTSSGGHLALLTAMLPSQWRRDLPQCAGIPRVAAVLDYYGPTDLSTATAVSARTREWLREGGGTLARELSPIAHARAGLSPVLIVHGDADRTVPHKQSEWLRDALTRARVPVRLHTVQGGGHGGFEPAQRAAVMQEVTTFLREQGILSADHTP